MKKLFKIALCPKAFAGNPTRAFLLVFCFMIKLTLGVTLAITLPIKVMEKNNIRKLTKTGGGTMYVAIPKDIVNSLGWKEHQKLVVKRGKGCIIIRDWRKR